MLHYEMLRLGAGVHMCNPIYSGGRDKEDHDSKSAWVCVWERERERERDPDHHLQYDCEVIWSNHFFAFAFSLFCSQSPYSHTRRRNLPKKVLRLIPNSALNPLRLQASESLRGAFINLQNSLDVVPFLQGTKHVIWKLGAQVNEKLIGWKSHIPVTLSGGEPITLHFHWLWATPVIFTHKGKKWGINHSVTSKPNL
jgi:hypothetical protein